MPSGTSVAFAKTHVKEILRREFNRSIELQVSAFQTWMCFISVMGNTVAHPDFNLAQV